MSIKYYLSFYPLLALPKKSIQDAKNVSYKKAKEIFIKTATGIYKPRFDPLTLNSYINLEQGKQKVIMQKVIPKLLSHITNFVVGAPFEFAVPPMFSSSTFVPFPTPPEAALRASSESPSPFFIF